MKAGGGGAQATGISGGHLRLDGSIARICKKFVMRSPIIGLQQRINHCPFGILWYVWHDHPPTPLYYSPVGGVPQLISALLLMLPAEIESVSVGLFPTFFVS